MAADSDFFADLGADSLVMARFCARIRKRADLPPVSMKDVYRHPTVGALDASLATTVSEAPLPAAAPAPTSAPSPPAVREPGGGSAHYVLCGLLQLLSFLGYSLVVAFVATQGYDWVSGASGALDAYLRAVVFGVAAFLCLSALPILAKWTLIGRWKPIHIRVWSLGYVRFWLVKSLVRADPLVLFAGSPLYTGYLRLLGARIGRGVTVFSRSVPVCTDLLTIGAGSVIRKDASFSCYRAHDGVIQTGPVTLGKDTTVSAATVHDIGTSLGDGARLGHASSLHRGQSVPAGEHWHGSPAQRADADVPCVDPVPFGPLRRPLHSLLQLLTALLLYIPLAVGGVGILLAQAPQLAAFARPGPTALTTWVFYAEAFAASAVLFLGAIPLGLLAGDARAAAARTDPHPGARLIARYIHTFLEGTGWSFDEIGVHDLAASSSAGFRLYLEQAGATGRVTVHSNAEELIRQSDLVVFATVAGAPHVLEPSWFAHRPLVLHVSLRDLAPQILLTATNIVDDVAHCLRAATSPHLTEQLTGNRDFLDGTLDDVMSGRVGVPAGRTAVFSPFGLGVLDLAVGRYVYDEVARSGELRTVDGFFHELRRYG